MPHALLLKYPGTNWDVETERALRAAGFSTQIQPIATATPEHVAKSQLVVLGGALSYGDYVTSGRLAQLETDPWLMPNCRAIRRWLLPSRYSRIACCRTSCS